MTLVGIGYRRALAPWLRKNPGAVNCLEITAEHFFDHGADTLRELSEQYPLYTHGLGLSLGTPGPLDEETLDQFARVAEESNAQWVSEHIAFTRSAETDLGHLNPLPRTKETLDTLTAHTKALALRTQRAVLLENITSHLDVGGDYSEPDFLNQLCDAADCRLLLDATNLFINSRNHGFDPVEWLRELNPAHIRQLHVVGYQKSGAAYDDSHANPIQEDLLEFIAEILAFADVESIILERDENLTATEEIESDLIRLRALTAT